MYGRFVRIAFVVACLVATRAFGWPSALPQPDLSTHDFRNGTTSVPAFNLNVIGLGQGGNIYVAGIFDSVDGQSRPSGVARLLPDGTLDGWAPTLPLHLPRLAAESVTGSVALVFSFSDSASHDVLVHVTQAGTASILEDAPTHQALAFDDTGALYAAVGGTYGAPFSPEVPARIRKFTPAGAADTSFQLTLHGDYLSSSCAYGPVPTVKSMRFIDGLMYLAGDFLAAEHATSNVGGGGVVRVSPATGELDATWLPFGGTVNVWAGGANAEKLTCFFGPSKIVHEVLPGASGMLYLAGSFETLPQKHLARVTRAAPGQLDTTWTPNAPFAFAAEMDPSGAYVYVGGSFVSADGLDRNGIAAFSTSGSGPIAAAWDPGAPETQRIRAAADRLVIAGSFTGVGAMARMHVAAVPFATATPTGPLISLSPRLIDFGVMPTNPPPILRGSFGIGNTGDAPLVIQGIGAAPSSLPVQPATVTQTNDCGAALAPGATCTVQFSVDMGTGPLYPIAVTSNGSGTPQTVTLKVTPAYSQLTFVDVTNPPWYRLAAPMTGYPVSVTHTLRSSGNYPVSFTRFSMTQPASEFSSTNDCPVSLAVGATCRLTVTYTPRSTASSSATLSVSFPVYTGTPDGTFTTWSIPLLGVQDATGDLDNDGIPNRIELAEGRDPVAKDNDVFGSSRLFAMQQYRDFLGREGDPGGISFWTSQIDGGMPRASVIESFFGSTEFQGTIAPVARLYFAYFLRVPDYGGTSFWIDFYRSGSSLEAISNNFAGSGEFTSRYGSLDNAAFVNLVYQNVLGRAPDPSGAAFWLSQLNAGMSRGNMMLQFSESPEYRSLIGNEVYVTMAYIGMLRRAPDPGGFAFWVDYLDRGQSGLALLNGFLSSGEYRQRFLP